MARRFQPGDRARRRRCRPARDHPGAGLRGPRRVGAFLRSGASGSSVLPRAGAVGRLRGARHAFRGIPRAQTAAPGPLVGARLPGHQPRRQGRHVRSRRNR